MKKFRIDLMTGEIYLDEKKINVKSEKDFLASVDKSSLNCNNYNNHYSYGTKVDFPDESSYFSITFSNNNFYSASLGWGNSICSNKGWDSTQDDLIADVKNLSILMQSKLNIQPNEITTAWQEFIFPWGGILVGGDLKNMFVYIKFHWN